MTVKYTGKVGPENRNSDYAKPFTVYASSYSEAVRKAIEFGPYSERDSRVWIYTIEEILEVKND